MERHHGHYYSEEREQWRHPAHPHSEHPLYAHSRERYQPPKHTGPIHVQSSQGAGSVEVCPPTPAESKPQEPGAAAQSDKLPTGLSAADLAEFGIQPSVLIGAIAKPGCVQIGKTAAQGPQGHREALKSIPTVNDMLLYSKVLNRVASGDPTQPDFKPYEPSKLGKAQPGETDESRFKRHYVQEAVLLGQKQGVEPRDMRKVLQGIYSIEGFGRIPYDMQSGTSFNYSAQDAPGVKTNEDARRNSTTRISSGIGYVQITYPANLHLINDDEGSISARLKGLAADEVGKPDSRQAELENKAKFFEQLQKRLRDEMVNFAHSKPGGDKIYFNDGQPNFRLYADFADSDQRTSFGFTGKEFTTGLHALLLDGDIGPVLQARQLDEDLDQTLKPEFQKYLASKTQTYDAASLAVKSLIQDAACRNLTKQENQQLQTQWNKLDPVTSGTIGWPSDNRNVPLEQALSTMSDGPLGEFLRRDKSDTSYSLLAPAGAMACNLVGPDSCRLMFQQPYAPTNKFISGLGYRLNTVLHGVNVDQFIHRLRTQMSQKVGDGTIEFDKDFDQLSK